MTRNAAADRQVEASDPTMTTWLSANAGSGKTRVLTDRVARLLLAGVQPQHILCLTYTKAAATEIAHHAVGAGNARDHPECCQLGLPGAGQNGDRTAEGALGPDEWRPRLGEFDWIILAVPATPETDAMIGAAELAAMKSSAVIVNIARGAVIDQEALVAALEARSIGGALLDVTTPEPLPADHKLWSLDNAQVTMHLSGRAQAKMFVRSAERFVENCRRYVAGEPLAPIFDPARGY